MRKGRFEVANGGTIFRTNVRRRSSGHTGQTVRVLQEREFERVGGHTSIKADVRILTATSRNLEAMIEQDKFRPDLYYRLNVFPIYAPPLRERKSDILLLADYFVEKYSKLNQKSIRRISTAAIDLLLSYYWPGNVRELENCVERSVLVSPGKSIEAHHLPPTLQKKAASEKSPAGGTLDTAVSALEYEMIVAELTGGTDLRIGSSYLVCWFLPGLSTGVDASFLGKGGLGVPRLCKSRSTRCWPQTDSAAADASPRTGSLQC